MTIIQEGSRHVRVIQVVVVRITVVAVENPAVVGVDPGTGTDVGAPGPSALLSTAPFREVGPPL